MTLEQLSAAATRIKNFAKLELHAYPFVIIAFAEPKEGEPVATTPLCIRSNVDQETVRWILEIVLETSKHPETEMNEQHRTSITLYDEHWRAIIWALEKANPLYAKASGDLSAYLAPDWMIEHLKAALK